ncbi:MAG: D-lyxose/D-mannose family sugar isomerase [Candidatus Melainabacteria bacterium]|nr:MAG: D-lyxose/D-mannose family sugar isomerase [Candidatus Melainabacteria bacterium]
MKRSQINRVIGNAIDLFNEKDVKLPPWAYWTQNNWKSVGPEADEIRRHGLGWAITDFASTDFDNIGLLLFIARNGHMHDQKPVTTKTYAEKYMVVQPGQVTPWHFHWQKTEDLLNRSGGRLQVELAWAGDDEKSLSGREVTVQVDGIERKISAEGIILLNPGESVTLSPRMCHKFSGYVKDKQVLAGEISSLNDDSVDNCFLGKPYARTPIDEDEPAKYLLNSDYAMKPQQLP